MADDIPESVKRFIFEFVDSVELLDVLLLMNSDRTRYWSAESISGELRANVNSIESRLKYLETSGFIAESESVANDFRYRNGAKDEVVNELAIQNTTRRHRILQLIFSPLKQARILANGFRVSKKPEGGGDRG